MMPLEGIRVLDLSRLAPGPFCTMLLGDLGADVLMVEAPTEALPGGASLDRPVGEGAERALAFNALRRNKRSIILNLRHDEARRIFYRLAETADVVVEGFRPGVVKRLGVDYETVSGVNPRLVTLTAIALASFITAVAVGLSGLVGFVGLVVPHSVRLIFGPDHRQLLPASALLGAAFVVICDTIARTIISPAQLPVGVITAIVGGPVFLLLLARYSKKIGYLR